MADALPIDSGTGGYNSPLATVAKGADNTGGAFVFGESQAANQYVDQIKETLKDQARQRAALNKEMADLSDVPLKGAWQIDLPELQLEKTKIRDKTTQLMMKASSDKKYANSRQYFEDKNEIQNMQDNLLTAAQESAQQQHVYDSFNKSYGTAREGKYKPSSVDNLTKYRTGGEGLNGGLKAIEARRNMSDNLLAKSDLVDIMSEAPKLAKGIGENIVTSLQKDGVTSISTKNYGQAFDKKADENIDIYLASPHGRQAVNTLMYGDGDTQIMPQTQAQDMVRQAIKNAIPHEYKEKKHYNDSQGGTLAEDEAAGLWQQGTAKDYLPDGTSTFPAQRGFPVKKVLINSAKDVYDHETHTPVANPPQVIDGKAGMITMKPVFDKDNKMTGYRAYVPVTTVDQEAFKDISSFATVQKMAAEAITSGKYPDGTEVPEDATQVDAAQKIVDLNPTLVKDKTTKIYKDYDIPYNQVAGQITGKGTPKPSTVIEKEAKINREYQNSQSKKETGAPKAQKLTGKINPSTLKKGQEYDVNGAVYVWDGKNLVKKK